MVPITPWRAFLSFFFPFLQSLKFCCSKLHCYQDTIDVTVSLRGELSHHYWSEWTPYLTWNWTMLDDPPTIAYERGCSMLQMLMLTLLNDSGNSCTPQVEMKAVVILSKKKKDLHTSSYHCWRKSCSCRHRCCCCNYLWPSSRAVYMFWLVQSFTSYR